MSNVKTDTRTLKRMIGDVRIVADMLMIAVANLDNYDKEFHVERALDTLEYVVKVLKGQIDG